MVQCCYFLDFYLYGRNLSHVSLHVMNRHIPRALQREGAISRERVATQNKSRKLARCCCCASAETMAVMSGEPSSSSSWSATDPRFGFCLPILLSLGERGSKGELVGEGWPLASGWKKYTSHNHGGKITTWSISP